MTQSHWSGRSIPFGIKSTAFWSINPSRKLLVFVHGFRGKALATWDNFATLLQQSPKAAGYDIIFYGYDGFRTAASLSGASAQDFLNTFLTDPAPIINATVMASEQRPAKFTYEKVVLVGHSLGAVVVRRAVLDAYALNRAWVSRIEMAFFAPAHAGAKVIELASEALTGITGIGALIGGAIKFYGTVLQDLVPNSSMLRLLLTDTQRAASAGATFVLAKAVWIGDRDRVIVTTRFQPDQPPEPPIPNQGHLSVCKPDHSYLKPVTELEAFL